MARLGLKITIYQANQELPYGTANSQCMVCKINKLCLTISYFWLVCPIYFFPPLLFLFSVSVSLGSWSYFPKKTKNAMIHNFFHKSFLIFFYLFNFFLIPSGDRKYKDIMVTAKCKRFFLLFFLISITESR